MLDLLTTLLEHKLTLTVIVVGVIQLFRIYTVKLIRRDADVLSEQQRRWISRIKNSLLALMMFVLITIWWPELKQFAFSIAAVAVALVVASKELILCVSGAALRTTSGAASVGDWIEIDGICGEVIEQNILSTVLQEIDKEGGTFNLTGKTIILPNSLFLSQTIKNLNYMRHFMVHDFAISTEPGVNVFAAREVILKKIAEYSEDYIDLASRYHSLIIKRSGMNMPSPEASVKVRTNHLGKNIFSVSLFCPTNQALDLEQKITEDFFDFYYTKKSAEEQINKASSE